MNEPTHPWMPSPQQRHRAQEIVERSVVVDIHAHPQAIMPKFVRRVAEKSLGMPYDPLTNLPAAGVDYAIVTAVGDRSGTAWRWHRSASAAVEAQLAAAIREAESGSDGAAGTRLVLGVEGADFLGRDLSAVERLVDLGIRVIGLMHYAHNDIGKVSTSMTGRRSRSSEGLTPFGCELVAELSRHGIVVDLAHADKATTLTACQASTQPVIASHTGSAAVRDFARYISDDEISAIADTGGLIGLWPARMRGHAMHDLIDFARHAGHIAELVGVDHLAIGTDKNGVPDYAFGYQSSRDFVNLVAALIKHGFSDDDAVAVMGRNAQRVFGLD